MPAAELEAESRPLTWSPEDSRSVPREEDGRDDEGLDGLSEVLAGKAEESRWSEYME